MEQFNNEDADQAKIPAEVASGEHNDYGKDFAKQDSSQKIHAVQPVLRKIWLGICAKSHLCCASSIRSF